MQKIINLKRILIVFLMIFSLQVLASSPSFPILPSDNIQDPGASTTPWGGCGPTDNNCYVTVVPLTNTTTGLDYSTSTGVLSLTTGYEIPTTASTTAWNTSLSALAGNAIVQNGNSFGNTLSLGTNDNQALSFKTNGTARLNISSTGDVTIPGNLSATNLSGNGSGITGLTTTGVNEGNNLYYTDVRARNSISSNVQGLSYSTTTGILSLNSNYNIPTNASTSAWSNLVSSPWSITGSNITYLTGNVGIGTTNPAYPLAVSGAIASNSAIVKFSDTNSVISLLIRANTTIAGLNAKHIDFSGSSANSDFSFSPSTATLGAMVIKANGNVGIGTTTPTQKLVVLGNALVTGSITGNSFVGNGSQLTNISTTNLTEGNNLFYTDTRARNSIASNATGLSYSSTTGTFSLTSGYLIPTQSQLDAKESVLTFSSGLGRSGNTVVNNLITGVAGGQTIVGGTGVNDSLIIKGTSGNGSGSNPTIQMNVGNNGTTNALTVLNNGNVGIGTTNPGSVVPNGFGSTGRILEVAQSADNSGLSLRRSDTSITGLDFWAAGSGGGYIDSRYDTSGSALSFRMRTNGTPVNAMTILGNGSVGIGTTAPGTPLDIVGGVGDGTADEPYGIRIRSTSAVGNTQTLQLGAHYTSGGAGYSYLQSTYWGGSNNELKLNPQGGNVTIGGATSLGQFTVNSNISIAPSSNTVGIPQATLKFGPAPGYGSSPTSISNIFDKTYWYQGAGLIFNTLSGADISGSSGVERMRITSDGSVGIGTTTPSEKLAVQGNGLFIGSVTASSFIGDGSALTNISSSNVTEGTNLFYLDSRARSALSSNATGLTYSSSTGMLALTSGYVIPTSSSISSLNNLIASSTSFIVSGGNTLGADMSIGTKDNNNLIFLTNGTSTGYISNDGLGVAFGQNAGLGGSRSNTFFVGQNAGKGATSAIQSNFLGVSAGQNASAASYSNFFGLQAGQNASNAYRSNFLGNQAGQSASGASNSNFFGLSAGQEATNASNSNFIGNSSGYQASAAINSNFLGVGSGLYAQNAANSIFIGSYAGYSDGVNNTLNTASTSIAIGQYSGTGGYSDSIAIGHGVKNSASSQFNIGNVLYGTGIYGSNTQSSTPLAGGSIGIGTSTPQDMLQVFGDIRLGTNGTNGCLKNYAGTGIVGTCSSDQRLKTDITDFASGTLDKVLTLKTVSFKWNDIAASLNKVDTSVTNYGLIAQNVQAVFPELVVTDKNGYLQVDYSRIVLYVLKALQELAAKVNSFSDVFTTNKLCVGSTCINEAQLKILLQNQQNNSGGGSGTVSGGGGSSSGSTSSGGSSDNATSTATTTTDTATSTTSDATSSTDTASTTSDTTSDATTSAPTTPPTDGANVLVVQETPVDTGSSTAQ
jgi:hypothetical protein